jgi:hypothetical protein
MNFVLVHILVGEKPLLELVPGMPGVLILNHAVPGEEAKRQAGSLALLENLQAPDQLFPETCRRPILDCEAGPQGGAGILRAVNPGKLITEEEGALRSMPPFSHILECEAEVGGYAQEPFKMGRGKSENRSVHRPFRLDRAFLVLGGDVVRRWFSVGISECDPQFVQQDFLGSVHCLKGRRVDRLQELRHVSIQD